MSISIKQWVNTNGKNGLPHGIYRVLSWEPGDATGLTREEEDTEILDMEDSFHTLCPELRLRAHLHKTEVKPVSSLSIMFSVEVIA